MSHQPIPRRPQFPVQLQGLDRSTPKALKPLVHKAAPSVLQTDLLAGASARRRMCERLRQAGVVNEALLNAMAQVPRHAFIDAALMNQAYEDTSLPIGLQQTISKPSVVARMIELLLHGVYAKAAGGLGQTLEIGTGCGYQAAVLARLSRQLLSVERLKPLYDKACERMAPFRLDNVRLVYGDGMRGHPPNAPYHSIIAAAGGQALPGAWLEQLAVGGRLVAPVQASVDGDQVLLVVDKTQHGCTHTLYESVCFVPLKSGTQ
jgi:protein-L-isoaspartate(D-aspartate) O-methyltransferase